MKSSILPIERACDEKWRKMYRRRFGTKKVLTATAARALLRARLDKNDSTTAMDFILSYHFYSSRGGVYLMVEEILDAPRKSRLSVLNRILRRKK